MCNSFILMGRSRFCNDRGISFKKTVICSNCPSGPKEFLKMVKMVFYLKNNNSKSLIKVFNNFMNSNKKKLICL